MKAFQGVLYSALFFLIIFYIIAYSQCENKTQKILSTDDINAFLNKDFSKDKTNKILKTSYFNIKPNKQYFKILAVEANLFPPYDIVPAIYKVDISDFENNKYYLAKVHSIDAVK